MLAGGEKCCNDDGLLYKHFSMCNFQQAFVCLFLEQLNEWQYTNLHFIYFLIERWHAGDRCLAPFSENGKLCEATITSLETDENGKYFAVVSFGGSHEQKIPMAKLCRIKTTAQKSFVFDDEDLEKPYFHDRKLPSPAVAFELSIDGDYIPYTINRYLRDYQREGALFLYGHYVRKRGCILGDDMGLGKTIQV